HGAGPSRPRPSRSAGPAERERHRGGAGSREWNGDPADSRSGDHGAKGNEVQPLPVAARRVIEGGRGLADVPRAVFATETRGALSGDWGRVQYDSRKVEPGDLFVAIRGLASDGHTHLASARQRGASAAVVESIAA